MEISAIDVRHGTLIRVAESLDQNRLTMVISLPIPETGEQPESRLLVFEGVRHYQALEEWSKASPELLSLNVVGQEGSWSRIRVETTVGHREILCDSVRICDNTPRPKVPLPPSSNEACESAIRDATIGKVISKVVTLKAIGYWRGTRGIFLRCPKPQWLVQRGWHAVELDRIIQYLRSGCACVAYGGYSRCRFRFCLDGNCNGSQDLTDGEWVWPEGLAHYIERHQVILPEEFVRSMQERSWKVTTVSDEWIRALKERDYDFWLGWASQLQAEHWYAFWRLLFYRAYHSRLPF